MKELKELSDPVETITPLVSILPPIDASISVKSEEELQAQLDIVTAQYEAAKLGQTNETN